MRLHFLKRIFTSGRTITTAESTDDPGPSVPGSAPVTNQIPANSVTDNISRPEPGFFAGANRFKLTDPTFTEVHGNYTVHIENIVNQPLNKSAVIQSLESHAAVLLILNQKRVAGAEFDATNRDPPQCHPRTREELRTSLHIWLTDSMRRNMDFIWLWGSAGVGKSAVAQAFAEHCRALGLLGATFFFSTPAKRDNPDGLITTIAYQLAIHHAGYKRLITIILAEDPSIVDKKLDVQFQKLIVEPSVALAAEAASTPQKQLAIIIDGLDECNNEDVQCELIKLIGGYVQLAKGKKFPFLWLVCSRSEWHLKRTFARVDPPIECGREELTCNAEKDIADVYIILKDGLQKIHDETSYSLTPTNTQWPSEITLQQLSHKVGGLPVLASTILRFITDAWRRKRLSPDSQLDACLLALDNLSDDENVKPLDILDGFYRKIMSRVPSSVLPVTKRILAFHPLLLSRSWDQELAATAFDVARFLCLDEFNFYAALQDLHSVLDIPPPEKAREQPLKASHKSFMDFLENSNRSGQYALDMDDIAFDVAKLGVRWYNHFLYSNCSVAASNACKRSTPNPTSISWPSCTPAGRQDLTRIQEFVEEKGWDMWCVSDDRRKDMLSQLQKLDFCHLPYQFSMAEDKAFSRFVTWLLESQQTSENTLVRLKPVTQIDRALLTKYKKPLPFEEGSFEDLTSEYRPYFFFSLHQVPEWPRVLGEMKAFWVGHGDRTVLVLILDKERFTPPES